MNVAAWLPLYAVALLGAFVLGALLTPLSMRAARRLGFLAHPAGGRHHHRLPTPTLGGAAVVATVLLVAGGGALAAWLLRERIAAFNPEAAAYLANIPSIAPRLLAILGGALAMSALGLVDDRRPLGPALKLALMTAAAAALPLAGVRIQGFVASPWLGAAATIFWVVFVMNAFNFLDNMDGLCAGVAAIVSAAFFAVSLAAGEWFVAALYLTLAGALGGFLVHNFHPAKTFLGDNGSLFIGYLIGALSVLSTFYESGVPSRLPILTPLIVLGVPVFDMLTVLWIRWRSGAPLMVGDRNHFSHRLLDLGMAPPRAATFIYVATAAVALAAVPLRGAELGAGLAILGQIALLFWLIHRIERAAKRLREGGDPPRR